MQPLLAGTLEELSKVFDELDKALTGLPPAALDWIPGPEMNSIGVLAAHTAGSVQYWVCDVALGQASTTRRRASEFATHGIPVDELQRHLTQVLGEVKTALESLTAEAITTPRTTPTDGATVSVGWAVAHALAHAATHLGHIQVTRQLWEQSQP